VLTSPIPTSPTAEVFIRCRATSGTVPTGVRVADLDDLIRVYMLVGCEACGGDHLWEADEALLPAA
jgi:hypothetical protein